MQHLSWKTILFSTIAIALSGPVDAKKEGPGETDLTASRIIFVTSLVYTGDLVSEAGAYGYSGESGLEAADAICDAHAMGAGLPGSYVAIISSSEENANARLTASLGSYRWVDGTPVAENYVALFNTFNGSAGVPPRRLISPVRMTELGGELIGGGSGAAAWTGSTSVGREQKASQGPVGISRPEFFTCNDWTDNSVAIGCEPPETGPCGQSGAAQLTGVEWLVESQGFCSVGRRLYCAQQ